MQLKHRMKRNRKATHIQWDVDDLEDLELLPTEIDIPDDMTDMEEISTISQIKRAFVIRDSLWRIESCRS